MATTYSGYAVYWYDREPDPPIGYGMAGIITDNGGALSSALKTTADMETNLNGDPKVEAFGDTSAAAQSTLRVVATDRVAGQSQPQYIYDPVDVVKSAPTPVSPIVTTGWPLQNLYTLTRVGAYLYAIDYDLGMVFEIDGAAPYAATGVTYSQPASTTSGYQARGQELINVDGVLYGLFAYPDSSFATYDPSVVVRFDISPGKSITAVATSDDTPPAPPTPRTSFAENAFALATDGTNLYVASIGGSQGSSSTPNSNTAIQSIAAGFADGDPATLVMELGAAGNYEYRDISFDERTGTAYIFVGTYNSNWNMDGRLFSTTNFTTLAPVTTITNEVGYYWSAQYTSDNKRVWFARGNDVYVYDATTPSATPGIQPMSTLKGSGNYDSLGDLCYIGVDGGRRALRGYKSHWQRSNSPLARAVRAITKGRPEPTPEELAQAQASLGK